MLGLSPALLDLSFPTGGPGFRLWPHTELRRCGTRMELEAGNLLASRSSSRNTSKAVLSSYPPSMAPLSPGVSLATPHPCCPCSTFPILHAGNSLALEQSSISHFISG